MVTPMEEVWNNQVGRMTQPDKVNQTLSADTMNTSANTVVS